MRSGLLLESGLPGTVPFASITRTISICWPPLAFKWLAFRPLRITGLPEDLGGLYFGGGYPELYAHRLAGNQGMRAAILRASMAGMPIYGECGGFMYLCHELEDQAGAVHAMCGCFPFRSRMHARLRILGYREVRLQVDTLLGRKGDCLRGHEFHYSDLVEGDGAVTPVDTVYTTMPRKGGPWPSGRVSVQPHPGQLYPPALRQPARMRPGFCRCVPSLPTNKEFLT